MIESWGVAFPIVKKHLGGKLLGAPEVKVPEWQSLPVADKPQGVTHELQNVIIQVPIPETREDAIIDVEPHLPWAEEHFQERVSGVPYNPPPSHVNWPFAQASNAEHVKDEKFSHTYPERMWPTRTQAEGDEGTNYYRKLKGIRFYYGDLLDVLKQLVTSPQTRQAYLPIWFPEDTGAVHGERVPCTLGYHFLIREGRLHVTYFIRSVDFIRHFPDDVYMAMRLGQWVRDRVERMQGDLNMGTLTMHMISLHIFGGDLPKIRREYAPGS